jgi:hypothetical protein
MAEIRVTREIAATLLRIIWRGLPTDYKSRYRMTIWEQFENEIRSAAYTSSLAKFISSICLRLRISLGRSEEERAVAEILLNSDDRAMLKMLREETTLLVLMVRVENEEKRAQWIEKKKDAENE